MVVDTPRREEHADSFNHDIKWSLSQMYGKEPVRTSDTARDGMDEPI